LPAPEQRRELPERRARPAEAAQQLDPPPAGRHEDGDRAAGLGDGAGIDAMLTRNGEVVAKGRSDAVLGNPVTAVAWPGPRILVIMIAVISADDFSKLRETLQELTPARRM